MTATATAAGVRFAAPNRVARLKLEVLSGGGDVLFEVSSRGSVLDWTLQDAQGNRLTEGSYLCVLTLKDVSGRLTQRLTMLEVGGGGVTARPARAADLTARQSEAVGPVESEAAGVVAEAEADAPAATLLAHDGTQGQLVTTAGDLSFRGGDFFTGRDKELMRLGADGSLEVTGSLLARGGIRFADGTILKSAGEGRGVTGKAKGAGTAGTEAAGTGTANRLAKWAETGGAGALSDSLLSESGAVVRNHGTGIQMTQPASPTTDTNVIFTDTNDRTAGVIASNVPAFLAQNGPYFGLRGNAYAAIPGQRGIFSISAGNVSGAAGREGAVQFLTGADQIRMLIDRAGNVGIGTVNPTSKLVVSAGGSGGEMNFGAPSGESGMAIIGTNRADVRFDGSTLKLIAGLTGGAPPSTNGLAITTAGRVGIGTTTPAGRLHAVSGADIPAIYAESANRAVWGHSTGGSRGVFGSSVSGEGVHGESVSGTGVAGFTSAAGSTFPGVYGSSTGSGGVGVLGDANAGDAIGVYGRSTSLSTTAIGVYGGSTNGIGVRGDGAGTNGYGVFANNFSGFALGVAGNATQNIDNGGLVKAMLYIAHNGAISRCYNSQILSSASSTVPCGFTVSNPSEGTYTINFGAGFPVDNRFFSLTSVNSVGVGGCANAELSIDTLGGTNATVTTGCGDRGFTNNRFMIIVY